MAKTKNSNFLKLLLITAVIIMIPVLTPNMYIMQIINMICIYIILGTSINVLTGFTGQLSLGHAAFFGIGAYTTALLNTRAGMQFFYLLAWLCADNCIIWHYPGGTGTEGKRILSCPFDNGVW